MRERGTRGGSEGERDEGRERGTRGGSEGERDEGRERGTRGGSEGERDEGRERGREGQGEGVRERGTRGGSEGERDEGRERGTRGGSEGERDEGREGGRDTILHTIEKYMHICTEASVWSLFATFFFCSNVPSELKSITKRGNCRIFSSPRKALLSRKQCNISCGWPHSGSRSLIHNFLLLLPCPC